MQAERGEFKTEAQRKGLSSKRGFLKMVFPGKGLSRKRSSPERAFCPCRRRALKNNKLFFYAFVWSKIRYNKPCQQIGRKKVYLQERKKEWSVFLHVAPTAPEPV
jgi:hypothetical protein